MMSWLEGILTSLTKTHPHVVLLMVLMTVGIVGYGYRVFAEDLDLKRLENKHDTEFGQLSRKIDYGFSELKLRDVEGQIFALERVIQSGGLFTERDAERLSELRSELGYLTREINIITNGERR